MLNEIQMKMLDFGTWPNRAWLAIHSDWDVKTPYHNRRQRRAARRQKPLFLPYLHFKQYAIDNKTGKVKTIIHERKR